MTNNEEIKRIVQNCCAYVEKIDDYETRLRSSCAEIWQWIFKQKYCDEFLAWIFNVDLEKLRSIIIPESDPTDRAPENSWMEFEYFDNKLFIKIFIGLKPFPPTLSGEIPFDDLTTEGIEKFGKEYLKYRTSILEEQIQTKLNLVEKYRESIKKMEEEISDLEKIKNEL